tara:strand:- start:4130 stop:7357 length:3228 start_codon:yes stop_codon:yes gene_type:complete
MKNKFVHLHTHSWYSHSDAMASPKAIVEKAKQLGSPAIGISEHGSLRSAYEFHTECNEQNIKCIHGAELYYCDQHDDKRKDESNRHILLIAINSIGWQNLKELCGIAAREGFYRNPRIDLDLLKTFNKGLICTTACVGGPLGDPLTDKKLDKRDRYQTAIYHYKKLKEIFGGRLFLEIQLHDLQSQHLANKLMLKLNDAHNTPLLLTCDAHYAEHDDCRAHDILVRSARNQTIHDNEGKLCYATDQLWLKSDKEIYQSWKNGPYDYLSLDNLKASFKNSRKINNVIDTYDIYKKEDTYPVYTQDSNLTNIQFLVSLALSGLKEKGLDKTPGYKERLKTELKAIKISGFVDYFLIIWDVIKFAQNKNILISPGRGSCTGSLVFYCIGVTHVDPIKYELPFERFLKPGERVSPPDADLDFQSTRRIEVLEYIKDKYGHDKVSHIITSNRLNAKKVLKDVSRVLEISYARVNDVTTKLPVKFMDFDNDEEFKNDLEELNKLFEEYPQLKRYSTKLCGTPSHPGVHAAGLLVTPTRTEDWVPIANVSGKNMDVGRTIVCEWDMHTIEDINLLKIDILGLAVLDCIAESLKLIKDKAAVEKIKAYKINPNDQNIFNLFAQGLNAGVFQFNSSIAVKMCKGIQPRTLHDLIAITSLGRTAVMKMGFHDEYIDRLNGNSEIEKYHPIIDEILAPYLGIGYLQETIMDITMKFADFTYTEADALRKAMKHKSADEFKTYEAKFLENAARKSDSQIAHNVWEFILKFSEYGFTVGHACAYSVMGYVTNYIKYHYPIEFYAGFLTARSADQKIEEHVLPLIQEAQKQGIKILRPSLEYSKASYRPASNKKTILMGFNSIKGLGTKQIEKIIEHQPYDSILDFIERANPSITVLAALLNAGCLDNYKLKWPPIGQRMRVGYDRYTDKKVWANKECESRQEKLECIKFIKRSDAKAMTETDKYQGELKAFGFLFSVKELFERYKDFYNKIDVYEPANGFSNKFVQLPFAGILISKDYKVASFITKGGVSVNIYYTSSQHEVGSAKVGELWAGAILYIEDDKYTIRSKSKKYNLYLQRHDHILERFES